MKKMFEDYFSELQTDMVSICLEYAENRADKIYIYCSNEYGAIFCDFFYCINGSIVERHKLNDVNNDKNFSYDTSGERQDAVLDIIIEDIKKISELCKAYKKDIPTEIKLIYDVKKNSLNADYKYDLVCAPNFEKIADDIAREWYEEIKNKQDESNRLKRLVNADKVSDHTAILPTKKKEEIDFENFTENERKILELVYQNLEEATSNPYKYEKTTVTLSYQGEEFTATGIRNLDLGWKKNRPDETKEQILPNFKKGDKIAIDSIFVEKHQTEPPERYTDGDLLHAMERAGKSSTEPEESCPGIGTVATRAEILEKLVSSGLVERVGEAGEIKTFAPTKLAEFLYNVLPESLKSAELTAEWESKLMEVEAGRLKPEAFLQEIERFIQKNLKI